MSDESWRPPFSIEIAKKYIGKYILIGITYEDSKGNFIRQNQMHGKILDVCEKRGFLIELKGVNEGKKHVLPPDLRSFQFAEPGDYTLKETNEIVSDPDLLCTWIITESAPESGGI